MVPLQLDTHVPQVWNIEPPRSGGLLDGGIHRPVAQREVESTNGWWGYSLYRFSLISFSPDTMLYALSKFISIPSVSNSPQHREDCRQGAIWLKKCLNQLGASRSALVGGFPCPKVTFVDISTRYQPAKQLILLC